MRATFLDWLDLRTNYRALIHESLYERVPGGARWRYVWGSTLVFTFAIQVITGLGLWMSYSPSATTAWESVYYIQHEVTLGWLLRGIHHFTAQAMIVLMGIHMVQVVVDGAYRAPREVNFWLGLILMQVVLGLSLTGYLLPWDQKGYWATKVATSIAGITPVVGSQVQQILVGGSDYGHMTLTRFFALHAGVLPVTLVIFLVLHIAAFRRHGLCAPDPLYRPDTSFWPDQVLRDAVACLGVMVAIIFAMWFIGGRQFGPSGGAELGAPADPASPYSAARPEWYFLFLFQFLKYFPGTNEVVGAIYIPGLVMLVLFVMPFVGQTTTGHRMNIVFLFGLLAGVGYLTIDAVKADLNNPDYNKAVTEAHHQAQRVKELVAEKGIGVEGARVLLQDDFQTQGPKLFARACSSCHRINGTDGHGEKPAEKATASDLAGFGSREWMTGIITKAGDPKYFGNSEKHKAGEMANWAKTHSPDLTSGEIAAVAEFMLSLGNDKGLDKAKVAQGRKIFLKGTAKLDASDACASCHVLNIDEETKSISESSIASGPELTGYASRDWLLKFIDHPENVYLETNAMPSFADQLPQRDKEMLADWLRAAKH